MFVAGGAVKNLFEYENYWRKSRPAAAVTMDHNSTPKRPSGEPEVEGLLRIVAIAATIPFASVYLFLSLKSN